MSGPSICPRSDRLHAAESMPMDGEPHVTREVRSLIADIVAECDLGPVEVIETLGGTASRKWSVITPAGRFVVRIRPPEFADAGSVQFDHTTLLRLRSHGLPVPQLMTNPAGETALVRGPGTIEVLSWMEGEPWSVRVPGAVRGVGVFLARFHAALAGDLPAGKTDRLREDHPDALQAGLDVLIAETRDSEVRRSLEAIHHLLERGRGELESFYPSLPRAVIHGDFHPGNVRFRGAEVAALYDFDYLAVQARVRDLVDALLFFCSERAAPFSTDRIDSLTQPFVPESGAARELLAGYQSMSPLNHDEWKALPLLMRSRWIQMRLRGSRKVPASRQADFVLRDFSTVVDWVHNEGPEFFARLRADGIDLI